MTLPKNLFQVLSEVSTKRGYSISAIARQALDRAVGAGLLDADTPHKKGTVVVRLTHFEEYADIAQETIRLDREQIKILDGRLTLALKFTDQQQHLLEEYSELITEQARDIALLRARKE